MRDNQFTIFDVMEKRGDFRRNPANADSRAPNGLPIYKKQTLPRMVYHPEGKMRITQRAEVIATPLGPRSVGEQRELINKIVETQEELDAAIAEGWKLTPAEALAEAVPGAEAEGDLPSGMKQVLDDKDAEIAELRRQLAEKTVVQVAEPASVDE